jgi:6-phosphogluconolactonase
VTVRERSELVVLGDEAGLAHAVADRFVDAASEAIARAGRFNVALAGGSTPMATHALLASSPNRERLRWGDVRFFFGDERCVPPGDPQSNYGMARATLFAPLGIDPAHVFRMRGEADPASAAAEYAQVLVRELGDEPVLDLIMLGMGPDGHTASLFPGSSPVTDDTLLVNAPFVPKFGTYRITLTPRTINNARQVVIATAGRAKADAVAHALDGPYDPNTYPVQIVNPARGRLTWMIDRAAAGTT